MRWILLLAVALLPACARAFAPPGGERDVLPPALVSVTPEPLSVVSAASGPVVFTFDERLSERNFNRTTVSVMPADAGEIRAQVSGRELRISLQNGWREGLIYQVVVRPGLADLFGNARRDPVELIFSTGDPPPPSALAGMVEDRITLRPATNGIVEATRRGDSVRYAAHADSAGFYALRHIPYGTYDVAAFNDANRNRRQDASETRADTVQVTLGESQDTATVLFRLLPRDTTGPRLQRVERLDSLHVRLTFDDAIEPGSGVEGGVAMALAVADSTAIVRSTRVMLLAQYQREQRDTAGPGEAQVQEALPEQVLVAVFSTPLPAHDVLIRVWGVVNVNGLTGGGVELLEYRAPPEPEAPLPEEPEDPADPDAEPVPDPDAEPPTTPEDDEPPG